MEISESILRLYIEKKLNAKDETFVTGQLKSSAVLMRQYLELKEALTLQKGNTAVSNILKAKILKKVFEQKYPTFNYLLRFIGSSLLIEPKGTSEFLSIAKEEEENKQKNYYYRFSKTFLSSSITVNLKYTKGSKQFKLTLESVYDSPDSVQIFINSHLTQKGLLNRHKPFYVECPLDPQKSILISCLQGDLKLFSLSFKFMS
jgi:hypothetical protein